MLLSCNNGLKTNNVFLPLLVQSTLKVFAHFKVKATVRLARRMMQKHLGFVGCAVAFIDVAADTGSDNIFPSIAAAARSRDNVV